MNNENTEKTEVTTAENTAENQPAEKPADNSADVGNTAEKPGKTYTEAEVEKLIAKRLAKAKSESDGKAEQALKKIEALEKKNACLAAGVKSDYTDDAVTLAEKLVSDKVDFAKALESVVKKYPQFSGALPAPADTGVKTKNSSETPSDSALRQAFGLK